MNKPINPLLMPTRTWTLKSPSVYVDIFKEDHGPGLAFLYVRSGYSSMPDEEDLRRMKIVLARILKRYEKKGWSYNPKTIMFSGGNLGTYMTKQSSR